MRPNGSADRAPGDSRRQPPMGNHGTASLEMWVIALKDERPGVVRVLPRCERGSAGLACGRGPILGRPVGALPIVTTLALALPVG